LYTSVTQTTKYPVMPIVLSSGLLFCHLQWCAATVMVLNIGSEFVVSKLRLRSVHQGASLFSMEV